MPCFLLVQLPGDSVTAAIVAETIFFWFKLGILIDRVFLDELRLLEWCCKWCLKKAYVL